MGGSNCKSNLVHLTAREHYIAHLLLYKFSGSVSMVRAFVMISSRFKISGRIYEEARILKNKTMPKKEAHSCWGIKRPDASKRMRENPNMHNPEIRAKILKSIRGLKRSEEVKARMTITAARGDRNWNYKEIISKNLITGEVVILGLNATAEYFNVDRELIMMRVRDSRRVKHPEAIKRPRRKLTDWDIRYNNDKTTQEI